MESESRKLKSDAIVEALFEMRFQTRCLDEVVISRLLSKPDLKTAETSRLPIADLPAVIRQQDPNLAYAASLEAKCAGGTYKVRLGARVVSLHVYSPYPGGEKFKGLLEDLVCFLFDEFPEIEVDRLGFRYVNLVREGQHHVSKPSDLKLKLSVNDQDLTNESMITFHDTKADHVITTKIASKPYISGNLPSDTVLAIDIDVATSDAAKIVNREAVEAWVDKAHFLEKEKFFSLFPAELLERLWAS